tara:strand:- start:96 stop:692 length:597 start_codon:yes stop_codon:yes gene_type:complete
MIEFINNSSHKPYIKLRDCYKSAINKKQNNIESILIASYSKKLNEVDSRIVNLKIVDNDELIFFSNYTSAKSIQFTEHKQISAVFYWNAINTQIRMKAFIQKTSSDFNKSYFSNRSKDKNALAISSMQSKKIESYDMVKKKYQEALHKKDLSICPVYWGGYKFKPYYFEFWNGHEFRINKREVYEYNNNEWIDYYLEP